MPIRACFSARLVPLVSAGAGPDDSMVTPYPPGPPDPRTPGPPNPGHRTPRISRSPDLEWPVELRTPRTFSGDWREAHDTAVNGKEPVFVPVTIFSDDRGWSMMNLLAGALSHEGQINYSLQYPGAVKAWHFHERQTDFWTCVQGNLKAGVHRPSDGATWLQVMGERRPGVLIIPPTLWHGATAVGAAPAGLLYYMDRLFDRGNPDEGREPWDALPDFPWGIRHG